MDGHKKAGSQFLVPTVRYVHGDTFPSFFNFNFNLETLFAPFSRYIKGHKALILTFYNQTYEKTTFNGLCGRPVDRV